MERVAVDGGWRFLGVGWGGKGRRAQNSRPALQGVAGACGIVDRLRGVGIFLAKRGAKAGDKDLRSEVEAPERRCVSLEDDPTVGHDLAAAEHDAEESHQGEDGVGGATKPSMHDVFGPGGFLERSMIGGYEHRPAQLEMAERVQDAFEKHHHAILEAGTGTGKTLAYLLPAICSGRRVVISTATKSLQEQLFQKDVPFLQKHFAPELKVAVMKGRANFLCRNKLHQMADQPMLKGMDELDAFRQIREWAKITEFGDRAELTFLHDDSELWGRMDARRDACTGQKCPDFNQCFVTAMHQRAKDADSKTRT